MNLRRRLCRSVLTCAYIGAIQNLLSILLKLDSSASFQTLCIGTVWEVLFPKHCNEAHDELSRYIKKCRDEQTKRAFREVYENLAEKANLTSKKLQIVCPKQTDDLITEGQALHHCVGTYIERVAAKKCLIVFVRRVEEPEKPFVTVEVSNGKIVQIRGERNSDPTKEVKKFVDLWSRKVLPMALQTA